MMQHQQMLYQQIQQEQQTYMMQINELQYALQNAPQDASAEAEETEIEKELEKFTNGTSEKSKAKLSKIEKLFERPTDGPEVVYLQDEGFILEDLPRAVHLIDMFGAGRFKSNVNLLDIPNPEAEAEPMQQYGRNRGKDREMTQSD